MLTRIPSLHPGDPWEGRGPLTRSLKSAQAAVPSEGEEGEFGGALRRITSVLVVGVLGQKLS